MAGARVRRWTVSPKPTCRGRHLSICSYHPATDDNHLATFDQTAVQPVLPTKQLPSRGFQCLPVPTRAVQDERQRDDLARHQQEQSAAVHRSNAPRGCTSAARRAARKFFEVRSERVSWFLFYRQASTMSGGAACGEARPWSAALHQQ